MKVVYVFGAVIATLLVGCAGQPRCTPEDCDGIVDLRHAWGVPGISGGWDEGFDRYGRPSPGSAGSPGSPGGRPDEAGCQLINFPNFVLSEDQTPWKSCK